MSNKKPHKKQRSGINTSYLSKMGLRNLVLNRSMTISSVSVLTACLMLIGISLTILFNMQSLVHGVEKQNVILAFVQDGADDSATRKVGEDLRLLENVTDVQFVSKEEAFADQMDSYGVDQHLFEGLIDNPLPDGYRITISNLDDFESTLTQIKAVDNVISVRESREVVTQISTLQKSISVICAVIVILLVIVSLFIITNTIRITMVSRKVDIMVMKSVGATDFFIRWPFMIEGIAIGLISGALSLLMIYLVEHLEGDAFGSLMTMFGGTTVSLFDKWYFVVPAYLLAGIVIGVIGCVVSISKYLRKEGSEANEI